MDLDNTIVENSVTIGILEYQWYVGDKYGHFEEIPGAINKIYKIKVKEIGLSLKVECTPVLPNGKAGPSVFIITDTVRSCRFQ